MMGGLKQNMGRVSLIAPVLLLACSPAAAPPPPPPLKWITVKDGSQVAARDYVSESEPAAIMRCWRASGSYDCLSVYEGEWRDARRTVGPRLPSQFSELVDRLVGVPGYGCVISGDDAGYQEQISGKQGRLTGHVHSIMSDDRGWTRKYVEAYMRDNGVKPVSLYFDCEYLADEMNKGSLATVGTTSIDREKLIGVNGS